jgi:hypothetical protein
MRWKPELTGADEDADEIHLHKASRDPQANVSSVEVIESIVHQPRRKGRPKMHDGRGVADFAELGDQPSGPDAAGLRPAQRDPARGQGPRRVLVAVVLSDLGGDDRRAPCATAGAEGWAHRKQKSQCGLRLAHRRKRGAAQRQSDRLGAYAAPGGAAHHTELATPIPIPRRSYVMRLVVAPSLHGCSAPAKRSGVAHVVAHLASNV